MIKTCCFMVTTLILLSLLSCSTRQAFHYQSSPSIQTLLKQDVPYPDVRFAVLSDLHFYDRHLGTTGKAFQTYLDKDRKLLKLSDEILSSAVHRVIAEKVEFVLVAGDLTKDGEKLCHQGVVAALKQIESTGIEVYVVPGNHDINNPESVQYIGDKTQPVPNINDQDFKTLYHEFGFKEAIIKDPGSLSYVIEPKEGLWVLALDSARWKENRPGHHAIVDGAFSKKTLEWIEDQLIAARKQKKAVIVLMHHGIMEHYPANEKFYGDYLVDEKEMVSKLFSAYGVRLVFTGHFHAQDITRKEFKDPGDFIFDIETGSLATAPCPYRVVDISKGRKAAIKSRFIDAVPSQANLTDYAYTYVFNGTITMVNAKLDTFLVSKAQQPLISGQVSKAYCAHLYGDEQKPDVTINKEGFGWWLTFVAWMQEDLINGWWTDLPPADNDIVIDLTTGAVF